MSDTDTKEKPEEEKRGGKFLFDLHNFDEPEEEEIEEDLPPPPTYYDTDLDKARKDGYQQGKLDGVVEAENKRDQFVAQLLETISKELPTLFHNEQARYDVFENEVVVLSKALIEAIFPSLSESFALHEITALLKNVMETHETESEIIIEVPPEYQADIEQQVQEHINTRFTHGKISVKPNPGIAEGNCFIQWAHGGAFRDTNAIAQQVLTEIQDILANVPPEKLLAPVTEEDLKAEKEKNAAMAVAESKNSPPVQPEAAATLENDPETNTPEPHKAVDLSDDMAHTQESSELSADDGSAGKSAHMTEDNATEQSLNDAVDTDDAPKDDGDTP